ncbi:MAG TPA: SWIM zinc finger family protein, partial [Anaerolineae bacterium]
ATGQSFSRGQEYYEDGFVLSLMQRGNTLYAEVQGSQYEPYEVAVTFEDDGIEDTYCTCPYDWGGICKHIVAVLLNAIHDAQDIEERPAAEALLADLDAAQLHSLLLKAIEYRPDVLDLVESHLLAQQPPDETAPPSSSQARLDPAPFRRRTQNIVHSLDHMRRSEAYWHVGRVVEQLGDIVDEAQAYIDAGDGRNALVILKALTEVYVDEWHVLDDSDGEAGGFFVELSQPWAEALLSVDLTVAERESWIERLTEWQAELEDYELAGVFDAALAAIR